MKCHIELQFLPWVNLESDLVIPTFRLLALVLVLGRRIRILILSSLLEGLAVGDSKDTASL